MSHDLPNYCRLAARRNRESMAAVPRPRFSHLPRPLLIAAHTAPQMELFLRTHEIPRRDYKRVRSCRDIMGVGPGLVLILLPGWWYDNQTEECVKYWQHSGRRVIQLLESDVLGPLCR